MREIDLDSAPAAPFDGSVFQPESDLDDAPDEAPVRSREGLPPAFRMRHTPHYVEQLMGEGPLQTVRQISVDQIHGENVSGERAAEELVSSIKDLGLLQPLLVAGDGERRFELLAGAHRLAAAREAGLSTVPCLVFTGDAAAKAKMRQAARRRRPEPVVHQDAPESGGSSSALVSAFAEIGATLSFVNALAPFASGRETSFRTRVLNELMRIETERATALASAAALLMRTDPLRPEDVDCAAQLEALRPRIDLEARYRGAEVEWPDSAPAALADSEALGTAWAGMLHAFAAMARDGSRLSVSVRAPRVRPALIFDVTLVGGAPIGAVEGILDARWEQHPGGPGCAVMLAAAAHCARLHRGRLSLSASDQGLTAAFVVPQPLEAL